MAGELPAAVASADDGAASRSRSRVSAHARVPTSMPFQLRRLTSLSFLSSAACSRSSSTNASIVAAIATSAAREVLPSSILIATPSPRSGNAAQNTASAPTLQ
jgi:hypothetical protein